MTGDELKDFRKLAGSNQEAMAAMLGLSTRQYQDLEGGSATISLRHELALELVSLRLALGNNNINLAMPRIRRDALDFAALVRGG